MPEQIKRLKAALPDRYAIERELGAGGMATVYLAEDLKHRRDETPAPNASYGVLSSSKG